jgi:hypothetical protein
MPTPPTTSYVPSRCQAQYAVWIRGGTDGQNHFVTCAKREIFKRPVQESLIK